MLTHIPKGATVFIDANIFLYHALEGRAACAHLFQHARTKDIRALTSAMVLSEVLHRLLLAEIAQRFTLASSKTALNLLRRHPEHLTSCTAAHHFLNHVPRLGVRIIPLRWRELRMAPELSHRYHLLTNDALIIATMHAHHVNHLASNDSDFRRVADITLWKP